MPMIRKQIYLEPQQDIQIKRMAAALGITEAEVIRRAIDRQTTARIHRLRDLSAWERERAFVKQWMGQGAVPGGRDWKREDAYEERLTRHAR